MENFIIICLLIIAVGLAIIPTIRHFKGMVGVVGAVLISQRRKN